jgi:hypothetical protein
VTSEAKIALKHDGSAPRLLNTRTLAERLDVTVDWLYHNRARLAALGFPKKLPVLRRWDPRAIDDWLATQRLSAGDRTTDAAGNNLIDWDATLRARLGMAATPSSRR